VLRARGMRVVVVDPTSLEDTRAAGADLGAGLSALASDPKATLALASGEATTFARAVFERHAAGETTDTLVAVAELGRSGESAQALEECVESLLGSPWVEFVRLSDSPGAVIRDSSLAEQGEQLTPRAPQDYWPMVGRARALADALTAAAGAEDEDARRVMEASLRADSVLWAGRDGSWSLAERGRAHAAAAIRDADSILSGIAVAANDITLSSAQGDVPVIISNSSGKDLAVRVRSESSGLVVVAPRETEIALRPADNYITVPVDLQSSLAGTLRLEVMAGDLLLAHRDISVRASYLDRLVVVGGVVMLLGVLLLFIRKRVKDADTDIIDRTERPKRSRRW